MKKTTLVCLTPMLKTFVITCVSLFMLWYPVQMANADHEQTVSNQLHQFNATAEELYHHVEEHNWESALRSVLLLEKQAMQISFSDVTHMEGVQALYGLIIDMKRHLAAISPDSTRSLQTAAKLRMASDAFIDPHQPMWQQYDSVLHDDVISMRQAYEQKEYERLRASYEQFKQHYAMIHPALAIMKEPHLIEQYKSLFATLDQAISEHGINLTQVKEILSSLDALLDSTFERETESTQAELAANPQSMLFSFAIGSVIVSVLIYVGWRKYRFDHGAWG